MRYEIDTNKKPSIIRMVLDSRVPHRVTIVGYDPDPKHPNTAYFARSVQVGNGRPVSVEIPMPITPEKLMLDVGQEDGAYGTYINVSNVDVKDMPEGGITGWPKNTLEFYNFLKNFAEKAGYIDPGFYMSKDENYVIWAKSHLDGDATPARVNRRTGIIKMNLEKLKNFTVFMRIYIGLHEFIHYNEQTTNEVQCDMQALKIYLSMNYPKSEANYAMTKVFDNSPAALQRVSILNNEIKKNDGRRNMQPAVRK